MAQFLGLFAVFYAPQASLAATLNVNLSKMSRRERHWPWGAARCMSARPRPVENRKQEHVHQFFHWFFHDLTPWVTALASAHPIWCFPIAFVVAFSESFVGVSFIIPGTFLLITLGAVIGASHISVIPAWSGAVIGSILGDWISFWLGFHYHHQILHIWPFRHYEDQLEKGLHFFHRFGTWAIFLGRFLGPFRATVPLVAGMSELEFWPFQIANTASAILWAFALLTPVGAAVRHLMR